MKRKYFPALFLCALALLLGIVSYAFIRISGLSQLVPQAVYADSLLFLCGLLVTVVVELRRSVAKTIYSYKNIMLCGAFVFFGILFIVLLVGFILGVSDGHLIVSDILDTVYAFPRTFSYFAAFVILVISILVGISNVALIRHEGFRPTNALSLLVAVLYFGGTFAVYAVSDFLSDTVFVERGYFFDPAFVVLDTVIPLFFVLVICYFECVLAGSAFMGWLAARAVPAYDKDYIIILGCSIDKRGGLLPLLKGRVNRAVRFAWSQEIATGKPLKYVPSGGQGANEIMSEGSAMELYLKTRGAEDYEVFPERQSRDTRENMVFSKKIIDSLKPDAKIAFATTNYHILRSGIIAQSEGIDAEGIAGDTKWYFWPNGFVREFFGILAMKKKVHFIVCAVLVAVCAVLGIVRYMFLT